MTDSMDFYHYLQPCVYFSIEWLHIQIVIIRYLLDCFSSHLNSSDFNCVNVEITYNEECNHIHIHTLYPYKDAIHLIVCLCTLKFSINTVSALFLNIQAMDGMMTEAYYEAQLLCSIAIFYHKLILHSAIIKVTILLSSQQNLWMS